MPPKQSVNKPTANTIPIKIPSRYDLEKNGLCCLAPTWSDCLAAFVLLKVYEDAKKYGADSCPNSPDLDRAAT